MPTEIPVRNTASGYANRYEDTNDIQLVKITLLQLSNQLDLPYVSQTVLHQESPTNHPWEILEQAVSMVELTFQPCDY